MAWDATFAALANGEWKADELAIDLKAALQERTGWVGDAAQHAAADALAVTDWHTTAWINSVRDIIEGVVAKFFNPPGSTPPTYSAWSKTSLMSHLYSAHGGAASGIGYVGGVYNWINVPTRDTLAIGDNITNEWMYWEHLQAVYLMVDHLRWLRMQRDASGRIELYHKYDNTFQVSYAAAWAAMKAATPTLWAYDENDTPTGVHDNSWSPPDQYRISCSQRMYHIEYAYTPIAGHFPTEWVAGKHTVKVDDLAGSGDTVEYKGPWKLFGDVTHSAAGAFAATDEADEFTLAAVDAYEEFDMATPDNISKAATSYCLHYTPLYDDATWPGATTAADLDEGQLCMKPTTSYGT